jgi:serine/threonine protein kinase/WD40 repeat protein
MADESVLLGQLAEEFAARVRQGQMPSLEEYAARHPALADRIRALFPTLMLLEGLAAGGAAAEGNGQELRPGAAFGAYRIEGVLGRGGMGVVYEAVHLALGRRVALKVLPIEGPRPATRLERFLREAQTAAGLHHTNIVPVFDVGQVAGTPYYAMQLIRGTGLDRACAAPWQAAPMTAEDPDRTIDAFGPATRAGAAPADRPPPGHYHWVAGVGVQVAEGLAYAHARGVIHRDIKPSNLILDEQGVVWITDFGLARRPEDVALTHPGTVLGTPRYMSPEQAEAAKRPIDHRTDVYSLGATLYELLTRRPAFDGNTPLDVVLQVIERDPVPPRRLDPKVPADLETIVLKAMAKKPQDRYPTAQALADDLGRYLRLEPILARRIGPVGRLLRWSRRHPTAAALLAVCVLSGLGLLALGLGLWHNAEQRARAVQDLDTAKSDLETIRLERQAEQEGLDQTKELARDTDARLAYEQARVLLASTELDRRRRILALLKKAEALRRRPRQFPPVGGGAFALPAQPELRRNAVAALLLPDVRRVGEVKLSEMFGAAVTPDGRVGMAFQFDPKRPGAALRLIDLDDGKDRGVLTFNGSFIPMMFNGAAVSPDGKQVAVGDVGPDIPLRIQVWEVGRDEPVRTLDAPKGAAPVAKDMGLKLVYSPDGRYLATANCTGSRYDSLLWDLHSGAARLLDSGALEKSGPQPYPVFSRDGKRLAVTTGAGKVAIWDVAGGKKQAEIALPSPRRILRPEAFGDRLLVLWCRAQDGTEHLLVWDTQTAKEKPRLPHTTGLVGGAAALSPDEQLLAASDGISSFVVFDLATGGQTQRVEAHQGTILYTLAWKPDSRQVISAGSDAAFRTWEVIRDQPRSTVLTGLEPGAAFAFSPDGQWLAVGDPNAGRIRLLHRAGTVAERDLAVAEMAGVAGENGHMVFRADSRQLVAWIGNGVAAWDVPTGKPIPVAAPEGMDCHSLAFGPDGAIWAAGGKADPGPWQGVWDLTHDREVFRAAIAPTDIPNMNHLSLSSGYRMLLVLQPVRRRADLWELPAGRHVCSIPLEDLLSRWQVVGGGDQRWVGISHFSTATSGVMIFALPSGANHLDITTPVSFLNQSVISADGRLLALCSSNGGDLQVWDLPGKQQLFGWAAPGGRWFDRLTFTPEGGLAWLDGTSLQMLDLPRLNQQLGEMGLGW